MATDSVLGLFASPQQLQQQQYNNALAQSVQLAQLTPAQQAAAQLRTSGYMLGGAIGGALGAQDPALQAATAVQSVMKNVNPNDPNSLMQAASQLQSVAPQQAFALAQKASEMRKNESTMMPEKQRLAISMADTKAARGTPEWKQAYQESLGEVINPEKRSANQKDYAAAVEGGYKGSFNDWIMQKAKAGASNVSVDVGKIVSQVTGKATGEQIAKMGESLSGLAKFERSVDTVEKLLPNSFTGMGGEAAKQLNKAAAALGASKGDKASNTEILENTFNNIVLPMARQLPGSLAAKELQFLLTTKPALQQEPATIRRLMRQMLEDYRADAQTYEVAQSHYKTNKSWEGFDVNSARYNVGKRMNQMSSLEDKVRNKTATAEEAQLLLDMRQGKDKQ